MVLSLVTPAAAEPLTLAEARDHVRAEAGEGDYPGPDDAWLTAAITAARETFEQLTGRTVPEAEWVLTLDRFPRRGQPLEIPRPPLLHVDAIKYLDPDGAEQTWPEGQYTVQAPRGPYAACGLVYPKAPNVWPTTLAGLGAVTVEFRAGFEVDYENDVPETIKQAIKEIVADMYLNREVGDQARRYTEALRPFRLPVYA